MAHWLRLYQRFLEKNGPLWSAIWITVAVTAFSVLFTGLLVSVIEPTSYGGMLLIGLLVPMILAPPIGYCMALLVHELSRAHSALQRVADRDMLTDAYTRRYFMTTVTERLGASDRAHSVDSVVLLDIDNFKQINDRHGHPTGDAVLRAIGQCCRKLVREQDVFARFGGEEFVILIGGATPTQALPIIERIRLAIRQIEVRAPSGKIVTVSASLGIASSRGPGGGESITAAQQLERALVAADRALYDAKHGGKDRTVIAGQTQWRPDNVEAGAQAGN